MEILKDLAEFEKDQICDVLRYETFDQDEIIIEEGNEGDRLYLIFRGTAQATKVVNGKEEVVYLYQDNDYFGDLALLRNEPRAASVKATSDIELYSIDRFSFQRLLGPV